MTDAEFKTIRESLGLSAQALADILGISQERTVRRWEDGSRSIPIDAQDRLLALDAEAETMARRGAEMIASKGAQAQAVVVLRYESNTDYAGRYPHAHRVHAAALGRLKRMAGDKVRIVSFDSAAYAAWRGRRKDSQLLRSAWAAEQIMAE